MKSMCVVLVEGGAISVLWGKRHTTNQEAVKEEIYTHMHAHTCTVKPLYPGGLNYVPPESFEYVDHTQ